MRDHKYTLGKL